MIEGDSNTKTYYSKKGLQKLSNTNFSESGKTIIIYYLIDNLIVKVSKTDYKYQRYYNNPNLDKKEATTEITKSYFQKDKMFQQIAED